MQMPSWIAKSHIYTDRWMKKKKSINKPGVLFALILMLIFVLVINVNLASKSEKQDLPKVVFYVSWFDVSEPVLDGLKGVELVNSDYHGSRERNTVWYDPALISVHEMENALKEWGIHQGTAKWNACKNMTDILKI